MERKIGEVLYYCKFMGSYLSKDIFGNPCFRKTTLQAVKLSREEWNRKFRLLNDKDSYELEEVK